MWLLPQQAGHSPTRGLSIQALYLEAIGGIAGDMALGALLDIGARAESIDRCLGRIAPSLKLATSTTRVGSVQALQVASAVADAGTRTVAEVDALLVRADPPLRSLRCAREVFAILAEAEATAHGCDAASVHFHEVGQLDSILDVLGFAIALDTLGWPVTRVSELPSSGGSVETAHGPLQCPVPAVRQICQRYALTLYPVPSAGESITPTGAALAAWSSVRGGSWQGKWHPGDAPYSGYGAGQRRFDDRPNVLRAHGW